jgi:RNA recognition motif. (a.k.a. RRM, RBD, or RNP domain)
MTMSETRIFIGNLPPNVGEKDLQGRLKKLGKLSDVTIKQRTDHEGRITSTFAHCSITADDVNKCMRLSLALLLIYF